MKKSSYYAMTKGGVEKMDGYIVHQVVGGFVYRVGIRNTGKGWTVDELGTGMNVNPGHKFDRMSDAKRYVTDGDFANRFGKFLEKNPGRYDTLKDEFDKLLRRSTSTEVSLEMMREWVKDKGLAAETVGNSPTNPIWIIGPSKPYKDELKAMGFKWGKHKKLGKGWHYEPKTA